MRNVFKQGQVRLEDEVIPLIQRTGLPSLLLRHCQAVQVILVPRGMDTVNQNEHTSSSPISIGKGSCFGMNKGSDGVLQSTTRKTCQELGFEVLIILHGMCHKMSNDIPQSKRRLKIRLILIPLQPLLLTRRNNPILAFISISSKPDSQIE